MNLHQALSRLAEITSGQWGLVTSAQALSVGVNRQDLARLARKGSLDRIAHGVYRDSGIPANRFDAIRAAWLMTAPEALAESRLDPRRDDRVVTGGPTAAFLHGVGDMNPEPITLISSARRQTQRTDLRYLRREVDPDDVTLVEGVPTTRIELTIADLVRDRRDLSLVADVLADAARSGFNVDMKRLSELLEPLARRNGFDAQDGAGLLNKVMTIGGIDAVSQLHALAVSPALAVTAAAVTADIQHEFAPLFDESSKSIAAAASALTLSAKVRESIESMLQVSEKQMAALAQIDLTPVLKQYENQFADLAARVLGAAKMIEIAAPTLAAVRSHESFRTAAESEDDE